MITKEDYLKLLDEVLKAQKETDLEINEEYLKEPEETEFKLPLRFNYVDMQGTIIATNLNRTEIDSIWKNQGNILVGDYLIKVTNFYTDKENIIIYFHIYDYEKDSNGKVNSSKIDIQRDVRFENVSWRHSILSKPNVPGAASGRFITLYASLPLMYDIIEWLQKLNELGAFV